MAYNSRNYQTRENRQCCDGWEHKMSNGQWMCGKEHGICKGQYSPGGYLKGPKHEKGGIPAIVSDGNTPIELEGEEYIMNAQTVKRLGVEFFDKLNSTATTYHQGGFNQGQLPSPSMYANGGKVPNRRNKMRRGRKPARRMARGGPARKPARKPARRMARGGVARKPARGRRTATPMRGRSGAMGARKTSPNRQIRGGRGKAYQRGGGVRKMFNGGYTGNRGYQCPNSDKYPYSQNSYLIQAPTTIAGTAGKYMCCPGPIRTDDCNFFDKLEIMPDLIENITTNLKT